MPVELKKLFRISIVQYAAFLLMFNIYTDFKMWEYVVNYNAMKKMHDNFKPVLAVIYAETVVRIKPSNPNAFLYLAQSYWIQGRHFYGYRNYLKALKVDPSIGKATREDYQKVMRESRFELPYFE